MWEDELGERRGSRKRRNIRGSRSSSGVGLRKDRWGKLLVMRLSRVG